MTVKQQLAALTAIKLDMREVRSLLSSERDPSSLQRLTNDLKDLQGAYDAICAIEPEWPDEGDPVEAK